MRLRQLFCVASILSLFACGDSPSYPIPNENPPAKAPLPNDCVNPAVRNDLGTMETGMKTIRLRARIAQNSLGAIAVEDEAQIANDVHVLNTRFESSNLRFVLDDIEILPRNDDLYVVSTDANPLCSEQFKALSTDSIVLLYAGNVVGATGQLRGAANACGAIINAHKQSLKFENISGTFSDIETVPRVMGSVLGLLRTNACYNISGYENDPQLSGDLVADTPFDPGVATSLFECGGTTAPGKCKFIDEATCFVQCSDGSSPDIRNIMSTYTGCRKQFSDGQSVYMRCAVELHHSQAKCDNVWANDFGADWDGEERSVQMGDVDGDGKADAILFYEYSLPHTWRVSLSTGSQFAPSTDWGGEYIHKTPYFAHAMIGDVNGDQKADAIIENGGEWQVALSTGTSFAAPTVWISNYGDRSMLDDVDGDGKADAVLFDSDIDRWSVALSTGSTFTSPAIWIEGFGVNAWVKLGDVDGDGKADAIAFTKFQTPNLETMCKWEVARSTGNAFGIGETWYEYNCSDDQSWLLADLDGDKKHDLIVYRYDIPAWFVHLSTGTSFGSPHLAIAGFGGSGSKYHPLRRVGDVDGDNKADFIAFDDFRGIWTTNLCRPEGSSN